MNHSNSNQRAILLLAHGGPFHIAEIPAFLRVIFGSRPVSQELLRDIESRYRQIGGFSPLHGITQKTAEKLQSQMNLPVYVGMKHWRPFIADTIERMAKDEISQATVICMAPHFSESSIGAYQKAVKDAPFDIHFIKQWHTQTLYIDAMAARIKSLNADHVLFTAHSLPQIALSPNDPYAAQVNESARLIAQKLALPPSQWEVCFQSAPVNSTGWIGPQIHEVLPAMAQRGVKNLAVAPIGFVCDHVEILYDIDIAAKTLTRQQGIELQRISMLNDSDEAVAILASLVASVQ